MMGKLRHMDHDWRIMHDKNGSAFFTILMRYLRIFFYIFKLIFALGIQFLCNFLHNNLMSDYRHIKMGES